METLKQEALNLGLRVLEVQPTGLILQGIGRMYVASTKEDLQVVLEDLNPSRVNEVDTVADFIKVLQTFPQDAWLEFLKDDMKSFLYPRLRMKGDAIEVILGDYASTECVSEEYLTSRGLKG